MSAHNILTVVLCLLITQAEGSVVAEWLSDGTWNDATGNGHGFTQSSMTFTTDLWSGKKVAQSSGGGTACLHPMTARGELLLRSETIMSLWVKPTYLPATQTIMSWLQDNSGSPNYLELIIENTDVFVRSDSNAKVVSVTSSADWTYLVFIINPIASTLILEVNGVLKGSYSYGVSSISPTGFALGCRREANQMGSYVTKDSIQAGTALYRVTMQTGPYPCSVGALYDGNCHFVTAAPAEFNASECSDVRPLAYPSSVHSPFDDLFFVRRTSGTTAWAGLRATVASQTFGWEDGSVFDYATVWCGDSKHLVVDWQGAGSACQLAPRPDAVATSSCTLYNFGNGPGLFNINCLETHNHLCSYTPVPATLAPSTPFPDTNPPQTPVPDTDAPPTPFPNTAVPPTPFPDTNAPLTPFPDTDAPATSVPATPFPDTNAPATTAPATPFPDTNAPATTAPATPFPDTNAPATSAPATPFPNTAAPVTPFPDTAVPPTLVPDTIAPDTSAPATPFPDTVAPPTIAPDTSAPDTSAPATPFPSTTAPVTNPPATLTPDTAIPSTPFPATPFPNTGSPLTPFPNTAAPLTTTAPATPFPDTSAPDTTAPTSFPNTDSPVTPFPGTTAPETVVPTQPPTLSPPTAAPPTFAPRTTVPTTTPTSHPTAAPDTFTPTAVPTSAPTTSAPSTLAPSTAVPGTFSPLTQQPVTAVPTTTPATPLPPPTQAPKEEAVLTPPTPSPGQVIPASEKKTTKDATSAATAVNPGGAKLAAVIGMDCEVEDIDLGGGEPLDWEFHPLGFGIGDHKQKYFLGAVVSNLGIVVVFFAVNYAIAWVQQAWLNVPWETAIFYVRAPGLVYIPMIWLLMGTSIAASNLTFFPSRAPAWVAVVGALVLTLCASFPCVMWFTLLRRGKFKATTVPDPKINEDAAEIVNGFGKEEEGEVGKAKVATVYTGWKRTAYILVFGSEVWVRKDGAPDYFVEQYGLFFEQYRHSFHWFSLVEMTQILVLALSSAWKPRTHGTCMFRNVMITVLLFFFFLAIVTLRPYNSPLDMVTATAMSGLMFVAVLLMAIAIGVGGSEVMMKWAAYLLLVTALLMMFKGVYDLILYCLDVKIGRRWDAVRAARAGNVGEWQGKHPSVQKSSALLLPEAGHMEKWKGQQQLSAADLYEVSEASWSMEDTLRDKAESDRTVSDLQVGTAVNVLGETRRVRCEDTQIDMKPLLGLLSRQCMNDSLNMGKLKDMKSNRRMLRSPRPSLSAKSSTGSPTPVPSPRPGHSPPRRSRKEKGESKLYFSI